MNPALKFSSGWAQDCRSAKSIIEHYESKIKDCKTKEEAWNELTGQDYIFACTAIQNVFKLTNKQLCEFVCKIYDMAIPTFGNE